MAKTTQQLKAMMRHYTAGGVNKGGVGKSSGTQTATAHAPIKHVKNAKPNRNKKAGHKAKKVVIAA